MVIYLDSYFVSRLTKGYVVNSEKLQGKGDKSFSKTLGDVSASSRNLNGV